MWIQRVITGDVSLPPPLPFPFARPVITETAVVEDEMITVIGNFEKNQSCNWSGWLDCYKGFRVMG